MTTDVTPDAFLSYTRVDDTFYQGAITSLRQLLELGVQVVTAAQNFSIFQDVDGTGSGQQYQKLFDEVLANALAFHSRSSRLYSSAAKHAAANFKNFSLTRRSSGATI